MKRVVKEVPVFYAKGKYYIFMVLYSNISLIKNESHMSKGVEIVYL